MSIYDLPADDAKQPEEQQGSPEPEQPESASQGGIIWDTTVSREEKQKPTAKKKRRFGCGSCLLGCLGTAVLGVIVLAAGGWFAWSQWPGYVRSSLVAAVEESDLSAEDQQQIITQIDRVLDGYQAGELDFEQVVAVGEHLVNSRLFTLMMADAAHELYVKPSGLTDAEKESADRTLQRVARGVFDEAIDPDELEEPLDFISTKDFNGERELKESISDDDLRTMLAQCKRIADEARVPPKAARLDLGAEFKRVVDEAIGQSS